MTLVRTRTKWGSIVDVEGELDESGLFAITEDHNISGMYRLTHVPTGASIDYSDTPITRDEAADRAAAIVGLLDWRDPFGDRGHVSESQEDVYARMARIDPAIRRRISEAIYRVRVSHQKIERGE